MVGLRTALDLLLGEGLEAVFARHRRLGGAVRAAVSRWGLELLCEDPAAVSDSVTAILLPPGVADTAIRSHILEHFGVTLGGGLGRLTDRCIRIGHLGDVDELMMISVLAALEMGLPESITVRPGGFRPQWPSLRASSLWPPHDPPRPLRTHR